VGGIAIGAHDTERDTGYSLRLPAPIFLTKKRGPFIMSKEKFIEKYGVNRKSRARFNMAIRTECKGGNELLDTLELVSSMRSRAASKEETDKLRTIEDRLQGIRDAMVIGIQEDYNF